MDFIRIITKPVTRVILDGQDLVVPEGTNDHNANDLFGPATGPKAFTWKTEGTTTIGVTVNFDEDNTPNWDLADRAIERMFDRIEA